MGYPFRYSMIRITRFVFFVNQKKLTACHNLWYTIAMEQNFHPVLSLRLFCGEEKCFGPGVAELLRRVRTEHSLRGAAISMGMAYSKAWTVVKNSEAALGFKLLVSTTGGKHGGGATLSPEAERLLAAYEEYRSRLRQYAQEQFPIYFPQLT